MSQAEDFGKILKDATPIHTPNMGELVSGTVISANQKMILVDLNGQFTGIIS